MQVQSNLPSSMTFRPAGLSRDPRETCESRYVYSPQEKVLPQIWILTLSL